MVEREIQDIVAEHIGNRTNDEWDLKGLIADVNAIFPLPKDVTAESLAQLNPKPIEDKLIELPDMLMIERKRKPGRRICVFWKGWSCCG